MQPVYLYLHSFFFFFCFFFCFSSFFMNTFNVDKSASLSCGSFCWSSLLWDFQRKPDCVEIDEKGQLPDDLILQKGNFNHQPKQKQNGKKIYSNRMEERKRRKKIYFLLDLKLFKLPVHFSRFIAPWTVDRCFGNSIPKRWQPWWWRRLWTLMKL